MVRGRANVQPKKERQDAFLEHFRYHCNVIASAEATGVGRQTVYDWRNSDPQFETAFLAAEAEAWERLEHVVRQEAMPHDVEEITEEVQRVRGKPKLGGDGKPVMVMTKRVRKREMNPTLAMFLLKSHNPERYRERYDVEMSGKGGGAIPISLIDEIVAKADGKESA